MHRIEQIKCQAFTFQFFSFAISLISRVLVNTQVAGFSSGVVHMGGNRLEGLQERAWAALNSEDFERFAHEEMCASSLNLRCRQSRHKGNGTTAAKSKDSTTTMSVPLSSFSDSAIGALAIMFDARGFAMEIMEGTKATSTQDDDGAEMGFSVTFGNEDDDVNDNDNDNGNKMVTGDKDNDNDETSSVESDNEDNRSASPAEANLRHDLNVASAAATAARRALTAMQQHDSNTSFSPPYLSPPAAALQSACATVVGSDTDRQVSSWFTGGTVSVRPSAARQSLEATAETCHALVVAATAVQDAASSTSEQASTATSSSEVKEVVAALQRSSAVASAVQHACSVAADAAEQVHAVASLADGSSVAVGSGSSGRGGAVDGRSWLDLKEAFAGAIALSEEAKALEDDVGRAQQEAQNAADTAAEVGDPGVSREQGQPSAAAAAARTRGRVSLDRPAVAAHLATRLCRANHRLVQALGAVELEALRVNSPLGVMARAMRSAEQAVGPSLEAVLAAADGGWALRPFGDFSAQAGGAGGAGAGKVAPLEWRWVEASGGTSEGSHLGPQPTDDVRRCAITRTSAYLGTLDCMRSVSFLCSVID